jgi:hypothetical protein
MNYKKQLVSITIAAVALAAGSFAIAQQSNPEKPQAMPEMKLPPGWTMEDMQACMMAATPGEMHKHLQKSEGTWKGTTTMWMFPGAEPVTSECTSTAKTIMDGRYVQHELKGEMMPGMPYHGMGHQGFDNVSGEFVTTWIDNGATGIVFGTGKLSEDGKTMTWKLDYNCPMTGKPAVLREVDTITGPNTKTLDMFATDPKSGKEYKMMHIELTRTGA